MLIVNGLRTKAGGPADFSLRGGEIIAVRGPSGSGKSLMLRAIADLDPAEGEVSLDGTKRARIPAPEWRRRVAFVPAESGWWDDRVREHFPDGGGDTALIEALGLRTTAEWIREFDTIGMVCGPLNTIPQAAEHPQVKARQMLVEVEHPVMGKLPLSNTPVKLSRTPGGIRGPSPAVGQHTDETLRELLGLSDEEIERLRAAEVIR